MTNWFGADWGAPICKMCPHCETPIGEPCRHCLRPIIAGDQGIVMPYLGSDPAALALPAGMAADLAVEDATSEDIVVRTWAACALHLDCFLETILPFNRPTGRVS